MSLSSMSGSSGWLMVFLAKKEASGNSKDYLHRICNVMSHMLSEMTLVLKSGRRV